MHAIEFARFNVPADDRAHPFFTDHGQVHQEAANAVRITLAVPGHGRCGYGLVGVQDVVAQVRKLGVHGTLLVLFQPLVR